MEIYNNLESKASKEFQELLNSQLSKTKNLAEGKIIEGKITKITEKFVFLFIEGLKSEPVIDVNELKSLGLTENITMVLHDWGSALGFDWTYQKPNTVKKIAYMEAIVRPILWDEWPEMARDIIKSFRSPSGETMILEKNLYFSCMNFLCKLT